MRDVGTVLRGVVAMLFGAAGLLHVDAAIGHEGEPVLQAGFALVAALQVGVAGLVLVGGRGRLRAVLLGGMALQLGSVMAWLLSRTRGFPEWVSPGGHVEPVGVPDAICVALELASLPACVLLLSTAVRALPVASPSVGPRVLAAAGAVVAVVMVPAFAVTGAQPLRLSADVVGSAPARHGHEAGGGERTHTASRAHRRGSSSHTRRGESHTTSSHRGGGSGETHVAATHSRHTAAGAAPAGSHTDHTAASTSPHRGHGDAPQRGGSTEQGHHHHSSARPQAGQQTGGQEAPPPPPPASAASSPPPDPCSSGATLADVGDTEVVYTPGQGAGVHVC